MPSHRIISDAEQEEFESGGGLKKETMEDRVREGKVFYKYVEDKADQVPQFQSQYYAAMSPCYQYPNMQYPYRAPNVYNIHNNNTRNWTP